MDPRNGEELDRYIGSPITLHRVRCDGAIIQSLLDVEDIAELDVLLAQDIAAGQAVDLARCRPASRPSAARTTTRR